MSLTSRKNRAPRLETLEARDCPAVSVLLDNATHTLTLTGDNNANNVTLLIDDLHNQLQVTADAATQTFKSSDVWKISLDLKGGNDTLQASLADGSNFVYGKNIDAQLGGGQDSARFDIYHGSQIGATLYSSLRINVYGGDDNDTVVGNFGRKQGGQLYFQAYLGKGDDVAQANLWGDVTGVADVLFNVQGEDGNDSLSVSASRDAYQGGYGHYYNFNTLDVFGGSQLRTNLAGGMGDDYVYTSYGGTFYGDVKLFSSGDWGNDGVYTYVTIQPGSGGTFDGYAVGNDGNDSMAFRLNDLSGNAATILRAMLVGGDGIDKYDAATTTPNVTLQGFEGTLP